MLSSPLELLTHAGRMYREHLWLFLGYAAWLLLPFAAFVVLTFAPSHWFIVVAAIVAAAAELFLSIWVSIVLMRLCASIHAGKPLDIKQLHVNSLQRVPAIVGVIFLQIIIFLGGLLLLIAPGILFAIWYSFAQPITAIEDKRGMQALADSKELVHGRFFPVLWRLFLGPFVIGLVFSIVVGALISVIAFANGLDPIVILDQSPSPVWVDIIEMIGEVLILPLVVIYITLLYLELKKNPVEKPLEKGCDVK